MIRVRKEYEKVGLKFNIQKNNIMAPSPIILWQIDRETVADFIILGSKITVDRNYCQEIERFLLHGRKAMANLDSVLNSRDITLPTKVHRVKLCFFPVVMYRCESCPKRRLSTEELVLFNCGVGEDS